MLIEEKYDIFNYILYKPNNFENLPLITVLHGSGERGSKLSKLKAREPYLSLKKGTCMPNACVLMPQLPKNSWTDYATSLKKLIEHVGKENHCNMNYCSLTGHSLGANGTMDMLFKYPDFFSAAAVLSPCKNYKDKLDQLLHIPIWFLHGEKEHNYKKYAQEMYTKMNSIGGNTKVTSIKGYGHPIQMAWTNKNYDVINKLITFKKNVLQYPTWDDYFKQFNLNIDQQIPKDIAMKLNIKPIIEGSF